MDKRQNKGRLSANLQLGVATVLCISGLTLLFYGMLLPPSGELHPSLLIAFGEISTFSGGLFGVDYCYRKKTDTH